MNISSIRQCCASFAIVVLFLSAMPSAALTRDEGMYAPGQVQQLPLKERGLKIDPAELFDPRKASLGYSVVRVDLPGGSSGTGGFVSPDGLILTNHHVAFDALVSASDKENDRATDGFSAGSRSEEIPARGYSVKITRRVEDVTKKVLEGTERLSGEEKDAKIRSNAGAIEKCEKERSPDSEIAVEEMSDGAFYYLFETVTLKDIRIVYAPPRSIGFFGGDTDNFEWTRHTGDFTFLRAYVGPDGSPAEHSLSNIPFKPRKHLALSLDGVSEGEFVFVIGYPGTTKRFLESAAVAYARDIDYPYIAEYIRTWIGELQRLSDQDPEKAMRLRIEIFSLNNALKLFEGNVRALKGSRAPEVLRQREDDLLRWIASDPARAVRYKALADSIRELPAKRYRAALRERALASFPSGSSTKAFSAAYKAVAAVLDGGSNPPDPVVRQEKDTEIRRAFEGLEPEAEQAMIAFFLRKIDELPPDQRIREIDGLFDGVGSRSRKEVEEDLAAEIVSAFDAPEKVLSIYDSGIEAIRARNPRVLALIKALRGAKSGIAAMQSEYERSMKPVRVLYRRALNEWKGQALYPDADGTLRFSFGNVKGYSPREAVTYNPFTTLSGMIEKDTGTEPFRVPDELKEIYRKGDYGVYGQNGSLPVNFLSDTDIIGGNSGSPVFNGYGEQIGVAFDGNYEGLGNDLFFDPSRGRTISVDIRYVLLITEKIGRSGWILKEMEIRKKRRPLKLSASSVPLTGSGIGRQAD